MSNENEVKKEKIIKEKTIIVDGKETNIVIGTQNKYKSRKMNPFLKNFENKLKKLLSKTKPKRVLEIGCGEGHIVEIVKKMFPECYYVAVDIDNELIKLAKERGADEIGISETDPIKLPYEDNSFDLVLMIEVLEHLHKPYEAIVEAKRLTKKHFLASVPREPLFRTLNFISFHHIMELGNSPGHINHWNKRTFSKFIDSEFKIDEVITPFQWVMVLSEKED